MWLVDGGLTSQLLQFEAATCIPALYSCTQAVQYSLCTAAYSTVASAVLSCEGLEAILLL